MGGVRAGGADTFLLYRKLCLLYDKSLWQDAHEREDEICRKRLRSARECAKARSFYGNGKVTDSTCNMMK